MLPTRSSEFQLARAIQSLREYAYSGGYSYLRGEVDRASDCRGNWDVCETVYM